MRILAVRTSHEISHFFEIIISDDFHAGHSYRARKPHRPAGMFFDFLRRSRSKLCDPAKPPDLALIHFPVTPHQAGYGPAIPYKKNGFHKLFGLEFKPAGKLLNGAKAGSVKSLGRAFPRKRISLFSGTGRYFPARGVAALGALKHDVLAEL